MNAIAWSVGWQELMLLVAVCVLPLMIAGAALLAVGLAQKKRTLWVTGIVLLCVPVGLLMLGAFLLFVLHMA